MSILPSYTFKSSDNLILHHWLCTSKSFLDWVFKCVLLYLIQILLSDMSAIGKEESV